MQHSNTNRIPLVTFVLGLLCMTLSAALPADFLENILGAQRIGGVLLLYICPLLGLIGTAISAHHRKLLPALGNIFIFVAFPVMMILAEVI